ncbi:MAG: cytochrome c [Verrucomicrobiota bacterium]
MSEESNDSKSPILSAIGSVFLFLVPASLIVMLGVVGVAFLGGSGAAAKPETEAAAAAPEAESAPGEAAATVAAAPAAGAAPAEDAAPAVSAPAGVDPAQMALGKTAYATCAACHGPDGQGLKAGPMLMAPSLIGSELLLGDADTALLIILKGIAKENMDYMGMMASLAAGLDDEKLAAVLTYTRNTWGNSAPAISVEDAAAARAKFADVEAPAGVKRGDIVSIIESHK